MNRTELAGKIETRIYETTKTYDSVTNLCYEAKEFGFASVQVFPCMIHICRDVTGSTDIAINAVIAYPHGGFSIEQKAAEAKDAVAKGAREVEVVLNTREAKSGNFEYIYREMQAVKAAVGSAVVKCNMEIESLTDEEARRVCEQAARAGVEYIVTSTGLYHTLDANKNDVPLVTTVHEIALLKEALAGSSVKIQAEGNIADAKTAIALIEAGADRISTEHAVQVVKELQEV